jgi:hypothetical protein
MGTVSEELLHFRATTRNGLFWIRGARIVRGPRDHAPQSQFHRPLSLGLL